ncbi:hypothetical protein [Protaetiibacter intestinalis]|uniref:Uncharacterized protein n=1 Tax=Protaetiibacter intestinalis TaxID=2419774 RepID=A0A387BJY6_9MICO|nr:hypothetical protein [Protaetiibacter intestinalis]AYF98850.1 hypothetical protein D7I47_11705 [Protaetiibacter intestinalis]
MKRRIAATAALLLALGPALAGCGRTAYACADWVDFDDAQKMYDEAVLVVAGTAGGADGRVEFDTGPGDRHRVEIDTVLKGELEASELWAASPRDYCVEHPPQPADDPIPTGERVLLFLRPAAGMPQDLDEVRAWSTLTPRAGVLAFPEGSEPPFDTGG